jgi:hypothetical protein
VVGVRHPGDLSNLGQERQLRLGELLVVLHQEDPDLFVVEVHVARFGLSVLSSGQRA